MAIIAFVGKAGSGKDTVAKIVQELYPEMNFQVKGFADKLREVVSLLTGIPADEMKRQEVKEHYLGPEWDTELLGTRMSIRRMLQAIGTDCLRNNLHKNCWVNALMCDYTNPHITEYTPGVGTSRRYSLPNWLITDCRFPNELEAVKSRQGTCIRIVRPDNPYPKSKHESETALDGVELLTIINDGNIEQLRIKVKEILDPIIDRICAGSVC